MYAGIENTITIDMAKFIAAANAMKDQAAAIDIELASAVLDTSDDNQVRLR
jgi:hypothetical protein